jgi:hypothetical protein
MFRKLVLPDQLGQIKTLKLLLSFASKTTHCLAEK